MKLTSIELYKVTQVSINICLQIQLSKQGYANEIGPIS